MIWLLTANLPSNAKTHQPGRFLLTSICLLILLSPASAWAERALLLFDPIDGAVIHSQQIHRPAYPASLTKLMTLYLLFEAIERGRLNMHIEIVVSSRAASQPPKRMGLKSGTTLTVKTAVEALIVLSANDVAVVVAEALEGDETAFAEAMNRKARELGMTRTVFSNASGLPNGNQISTARDIGLLVLAIYRDFRAYFSEFSKIGFEHNGKHYASHNNFLRAFKGARGLKTGFTCLAGYNLAAAAERDGQVLMGVVLGETTAHNRDTKMMQAMNQAFQTPASQAGLYLDAIAPLPEHGSNQPINQHFIATECLYPTKPKSVYRVEGWSLVFDLETEKQAAIKQARQFILKYDKAKNAKPLLIPHWARNIIYRVAITSLTEDKATSLCLALRKIKEHCIVLPPKAGQLTLQRALATMDWIARKETTRSDIND